MLPEEAQTAQAGREQKGNILGGLGGHEAAGESGWDRAASCGMLWEAGSRERADLEIRRREAVDSTPEEGDAVIW